jgi:hypothetical protein
MLAASAEVVLWLRRRKSAATCVVVAVQHAGRNHVALG